MNSTGKTPDYIRHTYKVKNELKSYMVYELDVVTGNKNLLTDILRIEKFQGKSNSTIINDYLRLRTATSWNKSELITGLRPTIKGNLFYGDWRKQDNLGYPIKTLLTFSFSKDRQILFLDVYSGFYPHYIEILQNIINTF
jgi:hypothetical protein